MFRTLSALLASMLMLGLSATSIAAQNDANLSPTDVEGFVSGYGRAYAPSTAASPEAGMSENPISVIVSGITFDSEENATAYMDNLQTIATDLEEQSVTVEFTELESGHGDQAYDVSGEIESGDVTGFVQGSYVRTGSLVYYVTATSLSEDGLADTVTSFTTFLAEHEPSEDDVVFTADGTSTGGVFAMFPTLDDADAVGGMEPVSDIDLSTVATPEA